MEVPLAATHYMDIPARGKHWICEHPVWRCSVEEVYQAFDSVQAVRCGASSDFIRLLEAAEAFFEQPSKQQYAQHVFAAFLDDEATCACQVAHFNLCRFSSSSGAYGYRSLGHKEMFDFQLGRRLPKALAQSKEARRASALDVCIGPEPTCQAWLCFTVCRRSYSLS